MRRILVTGAASGIGAAVCQAMAGPGVALLVHTRKNRAGADAVAEAARAAGSAVEVCLADLSEPDAADRVVAEAVRHFGGVDVVVSNAGFADRTPFASLTDAAMAASVEAIQGAFFRLARAAVPHLKHGSDPRIVAVSSFVAHTFRTDVATFPASAAAKAAGSPRTPATPTSSTPAPTTASSPATTTAPAPPATSPSGPITPWAPASKP